MTETTDFADISEQYLDLWQSQIEASSAGFWTAFAAAATWARQSEFGVDAATHNDDAAAGPTTASGPSRRR